MDSDKRHEYNERLERVLQPEEAIRVATRKLMFISLTSTDPEQVEQEIRSFSIALSRAEQEKIPFGKTIAIISEVAEDFKR